ncbi:probable BOI-related E3 ubiquitin-protein ligase 2 [Salvia miltiorrhiza]|uniref:probable BOI-related E3 ubiquitin-protein ligase 2 n=1 Tax=Salvia miltiorrhiza TaxID=226208 RepID=UPI0025AD614A|nr:probable BOI-related E3 ubiquitin-protein ligase 2 [Salvia miltiorrhiza]
MAIQAHLFSENLGFPLGNSQDNLLVENGCGFDNLCFAPQQFIQLDQFQNSLVDNNAQFHQHQFMTFSQSVSSHIERQRFEFDNFVNLQNERLRMAMQEQRKQQIAVLMKKYEWKTELLLKQKDEEIAKAANRTTELHNFMKRMEMENQTWQRAAKENEAMIASLNSSIQRLRESAYLSENAAEDAESCCQNMERIQQNTEINKKMVCRCCNSRNSCVVMLPCRHLCSCKDCEVFLDSCPVCSMAKKAAIEALI